HKKEGDTIQVDDHLADVETDKATMEFRSFDKGTLLKVLVPEGSIVKLGQPVAIVGAPGEDISGLLAGLGGEGPTPGKPAAEAPKTEPLPPEAEKAAPAEPRPEGRLRAPPYVRKLAREHDIDLRGVTGSGPKGRIVARDLEGHLAAEKPAVPAPVPSP